MTYNRDLIIIISVQLKQSCSNVPSVGYQKRPQEGSPPSYASFVSVGADTRLKEMVCLLVFIKLSTFVYTNTTENRTKKLSGKVLVRSRSYSDNNVPKNYKIDVLV